MTPQSMNNPSKKRRSWRSRWLPAGLAALSTIGTLGVVSPASAAVDAGVLGTDVREVPLGTIAANTSGTVTVDVAAGDISFVVVADVAGIDTPVAISQITAPDGSTFSSVYGGPVEGRGDVAAQWPLTPTQSFAPGRYTITAESSQTVTMTALIKRGDANAAQTLDLSVWMVTTSQEVLNPTNRAAVESAWRTSAQAIFGPHQITIGKISFIEAPSSVVTQYKDLNLPRSGTDVDQRELCTAFNQVTKDDRALHLVLVDTIVDAEDPTGETLGNASGIPGAPIESDWQASCVTVSGLASNTFAANAQTTWHEVGHLLGLRHTSETTGADFDFVADTPQCTIADGKDTDCPDGTNFMFNDTENTQMTAGQAFVLRRNPLLQGPAIAAPTTVAGATTVGEILAASDYTAADAGTLRLYRAFLDREPDVAGAKYWIAQSRAGSNPDDLSWSFANSSEFTTRYGTLSNADFLTLVYRNMLGRAPEQAGFDYWLGQMSGGLQQFATVRWIVANDEFAGRFPYAPTGS